MSPFIFKTFGTSEQVTLDFADIRKISHDFDFSLAPQDRVGMRESKVNLHIVTVNLGRLLLVISEADFIQMTHWVESNAPTQEGLLTYLSTSGDVAQVGGDTFTPRADEYQRESLNVINLDDFCATTLGVPFNESPKVYQKTSTDLEAVMSHRPLPLGVREALGNIITHSGNILDALQCMRAKAIADETRDRRIGTQAGEEDADPRNAGSFWDHEIDAFNRIVTDAREAMGGIGR